MNDTLWILPKDVFFENPTLTEKMHCPEQFLRTASEYSVIILQCSLFTCKLGLRRIL